MSFLTQEELKTHLYAENIDVITREDDTLVVAAIDAATQEAKGYLGAFDKTAIFAAVADARNALLLTFVKDIAAWHLINLCNAGSDMKLRQDRYERAIAWLKDVQKGNITPDLPVVTVEGETAAVIQFGGNEKRNQHF
jgi:phage gp36-like protein